MIRVEGLDDLVTDFRHAPLEARAGTRRAVQAASKRIKDDAIQAITGTRYAPHYPRSIGYDTWERGVGEVEAEIGADKGKPQGALGNILEYGTVNNAPRPHLRPALDREAPRFERAIVEILERTL